MPPPIAGTSFSSLGSSTTTASVVVINDDTLQLTVKAFLLRNESIYNRTVTNIKGSLAYLAASTKAVLITFSGSIIPALTMSTYSPAREQ